MNAENILQSDLLDIVFEGRNKSYGAYTLRRDYNKRLFAALGGVSAIVLIVSAMQFFQRDPEMITTTMVVTDSVFLQPLTEIDKPEPIKPKPQPPAVDPPATIDNATPVIKPDIEVPETEVPEQADLENRVISTQTKEGDGDQDIVPVTPSTGIGTDPAPAPAPAPEPEVLLTSEIMPEFPGGVSALIRFLSRNLQVPEDKVEPGQKIKVPVRFVVSKDGTLSGIEFAPEADEAFKSEIRRVMKKMPKWKPGSQHGRTVSVFYTIPIIFQLEGD